MSRLTVRAIETVSHAPQSVTRTRSAFWMIEALFVVFKLERTLEVAENTFFCALECDGKHAS